MISKKKKAELNVFKDAKVLRAHDFGNGQISFDCTFDNLVTIYGMKYIEGERNGEEYAFISFPQMKGKDGNYYNRAYINIDEKLMAQIVERLEQLTK